MNLRAKIATNLLRSSGGPLFGATLVISLVLFGSLPGRGTQTVHAQETTETRQKTQPELKESSPTSSARLTADECGRLYSHQLKIVQSDPDNPLYSSVQLNAVVLENSETRQAEVRHCQTRVSRASFDCQMAADSLADLLECRRNFAANQTDPASIEDTKPSDTQEAYFEDASTNNGSGPTGENTGRPETMPSGRFTVNQSNCQRAYNHIYSVISKTETFQKRSDRVRLENYWQSGEARGSFAARCLAKFKPEDLGCLLSTRDADVLQGCLLVIPAGA